MAVITATKENYTELILSDGTAVVFWAPWCSFCKRLTPVLKELEQEYPKLRMVLVNIDDLEEISDQYGIEIIPSMLVFHNQKPSEVFVAPQRKEDVITWLYKQKAYGLV